MNDKPQPEGKLHHLGAETKSQLQSGPVLSHKHTFLFAYTCSLNISTLPVVLCSSLLVSLQKRLNVHQKFQRFRFRGTCQISDSPLLVLRALNINTMRRPFNGNNVSLEFLFIYLFIYIYIYIYMYVSMYEYNIKLFNNTIIINMTKKYYISNNCIIILFKYRKLQMYYIYIWKLYKHK